MEDIFKKLVNLEVNPELDEQAAYGFAKRLKNRESHYLKVARSHHPSDEFFKRSYNYHVDNL